MLSEAWGIVQYGKQKNKVVIQSLPGRSGRNDVVKSRL